MSVVSGITLLTGVSEDYIEQEDGSDRWPLIERINIWLDERNFSALTSVEDHYGGSKHPQLTVHGAGFNYFPEDDFAAFVLSLPWKQPENMLLIIQPEEGPTKVYRPSY
jgi:hypothetical protein